jgi:hypothetical protein
LTMFKLNLPSEDKIRANANNDKASDLTVNFLSIQDLSERVIIRGMSRSGSSSLCVKHSKHSANSEEVVRLSAGSHLVA